MKVFSSLAAVMALWLAVSFLLWLLYRLFRHRDGSKQMRLLEGAIALIDEGASIFAALRVPASAKVTAYGTYRPNLQTEETLREDVRALLNGIEAQSGYFERVNAAKKKIQKVFRVQDFPALSELLQIRRDFWAASEIFLMEGIQELGPELAGARDFETFQAEARALLFKDEAILADGTNRDAVDLRLAIAREDALAFQAEAKRTFAEAMEKSRMPTPAELAAIPWGLLKGAGAGLREARYLLADAAVTAQSLARAMTSKGLKGAAEELRRARTGMPGQFAAAFERAGGLARQGGQALKRHYEFVLEAQELRARYAELLARAPVLTEKGKQFLVRLELERRAEQLLETSGSVSDWARQRLVGGIAYLIAGLQHVQGKITPPGHKQLAPLAAGSGFAPAAPAPEEIAQPLRVRLLPASAYSSEAGGSALHKRTRAASRAVPEEAIEICAPGEVRLRDLVTGGAAAPAEEKPAKRAPKGKPRVSPAGGMKKSPLIDLRAESAKEVEDGAVDGAGEQPRRGGGSLLERLSSVATEPQAAPDAVGARTASQETPKPKGRRLFRSGSKGK
jgi:hypothetical protein